MTPRTDRKTALLIDAAINAAASHGCINAARELIEQGVPFDVAMRVLTRPTDRRPHDWIRAVHEVR
jgi:hypothetical protein